MEEKIKVNKNREFCDDSCPSLYYCKYCGGRCLLFKVKLKEYEENLVWFRRCEQCRQEKD